MTDATYHSPDIDGVTFDKVVALSKSIDPVNFYIITPGYHMDTYSSLAEATDGAVVNSTSDLSILTGSIMSRFDSLPRVEENLETDEETPTIGRTSSVWLSETEAKVSWDTDGKRTLVALNDYVLGVAETNSIVLTGLNRDASNKVFLVPLGENVRGEGVEVDLELGQGELKVEGVAIPKAPNTGRAN